MYVKNQDWLFKWDDQKSTPFRLSLGPATPAPTTSKDHKRPENPRSPKTIIKEVIVGFCLSVTVEKTGHWKSLMIVGVQVGGGLTWS
jgi:hypothetical protein